MTEIPEELIDEGIKHLIRLIDKSMFSAMGKVIAENNISKISVCQLCHVKVSKKLRMQS